MFKDILGPNNPDDSQNYDDEGFYKDNEEADHPSECQCYDCLEEAIKQLCDQMGIDLNDEELEDIKIEYYNNEDDKNLNPFSLRLCIATARKFHKDVMNDIRDMNWNKY